MPTAYTFMDAIYLDHNATTPIHPEVVQAMAQCYHDGYANPASQHNEGRRARRALEQSRERIAALLGADLTSLRADQLIFTSGGTESNNLAVLGLTASSPGKVIRSAIEHPSVIGQANRDRWHFRPRLGAQSSIQLIKPDRQNASAHNARGADRANQNS